MADVKSEMLTLKNTKNYVDNKQQRKNICMFLLTTS